MRRGRRARQPRRAKRRARCAADRRRLRRCDRRVVPERRRRHDRAADARRRGAAAGAGPMAVTRTIADGMSGRPPAAPGAGRTSSPPVTAGKPARTYGMPSAERQILLAPDVVAKGAARVAPLPEQRWMLRQPRPLRRSFADEVFDQPDMERRQQVWMLRQADDVRESFIAHVLEKQHPRPRDQIWMLRQSEEIRDSYVREVLSPG